MKTRREIPPLHQDTDTAIFFWCFKKAKDFPEAIAM